MLVSKWGNSLAVRLPKALVDQLAEKPNRVIFSGKAPKLTPEDEIIKSNKPLPGKKP